MRARLLTYEYPPFRGGIAAYLSSLVKFAPPSTAVEVAVPPAGEHWLVTAWKNLRAASGYDLLIVSHALPAGYAAWAQKKLLRKPYAVIAHGTDILTARRSAWKRRLLRMVLASADFVVANSRFTAGLLREEGIACAEIIPPSVTPAAARDNSSGHRVVSVGRLAERKGFDTGIKALGLVKADFPDAEYVIVGNGQDRERLSKAIADQKLEDSVTVVTDADDSRKSAELSAASVFVLPARAVGSDIEGFGIATLEASAAGLPVIVARSGGAAEPVVDGVTGMVIEPNDHQALAAAIKKIFSDPAAARKMGEAGRSFVSEEYAAGKMAKKFWELAEAKAQNGRRP